MRKDIEIINLMIIRNIIPKHETFDVNQTMIDSFYSIYREVNKPKTDIVNRKTNIKFAKKLAGLSLMKLNICRSSNQDYSCEVKIKVKKPKCGILYLISNPAFEGMYKIGITQDLDKRLSTYQTYDPLRRYKVEHYIFVSDRRKTEKEYLDVMKLDIVKGEWVSGDKVKELYISWSIA